MNGFWSENELAELQPRKNPPPSYATLHDAIPKVQPLVPEISLFVPSIKESASAEPSISNECRVPTISSEAFSKNLEPPGLSPLNKSSENKLDTSCKSEDVLNILRLQSDQLVKLQSQVQRLLSIQAENNKKTNSSSENLIPPTSGMNKGIHPTPDANKGIHPLVPSEETTNDVYISIRSNTINDDCNEDSNDIHMCLTRNISDNFTQTSAPSTPNKKQAGTNTSMNLSRRFHDVQNSQIMRLIDDIATNKTSLSLCSNLEILQDSRTQSILLGESASNYGKVETSSESSYSEEQFEKILSQVQRLLSPSQCSNVSPLNQENLSKSSCTNVTLIETVDRVKQMGASFLKPSDFLSDVKERNPVDTFYEPKARESSCLDSVLPNASSDASLIINTAALKYLTDDQLSHVAQTRSPRTAVEGLNRPFGLSEHHLSLSTRKFLRQHQLFDEPSSSAPDSSHEET
nr:uncharacterized protein LOC121114347 [Lepeophtheirus salmonis]